VKTGSDPPQAPVCSGTVGPLSRRRAISLKARMSADLYDRSGTGAIREWAVPDRRIGSLQASRSEVVGHLVRHGPDDPEPGNRGGDRRVDAVDGEARHPCALTRFHGPPAMWPHLILHRDRIMVAQVTERGWLA